MKEKFHILQGIIQIACAPHGVQLNTIERYC